MKRRNQDALVMLQAWFESLHDRKQASGSWGSMSSAIMLPLHIVHALVKERVIPTQPSYRRHFTVDIANLNLSLDGTKLVSIAQEEPAPA